jgi:hypothetical protein
VSASKADRHGPTRFRTYRSVHENRMDQFVAAGDFVHRHTLRYEARRGFIVIVGQIACSGEIVLTIEKALEVLDADADDVLDGGATDALVRTYVYSYNASIRGHQSFLRYDNTHSYTGHDDEHHKHELDWRTGAELPGSPSWVGRDRWPLLSEFIESVARWYWDHRDELPNPDGVAAIDDIAPRLFGPT